MLTISISIIACGSSPESKDTQASESTVQTAASEPESTIKTDPAVETETKAADTESKAITEEGTAAITEMETQAITEAKPAETETPAASNVTMGQTNALSKAHDYLNVTAFSYSGLIKQLEFEGFSTEEATYGADSCGADWNEQAAKKAKEYLDVTSFSRSGLIEQLEFEGFTTEQAEYGVTSVGY